MTQRQNLDTTHTKIFVGGLPWTTRNEGLRNFFQQFGEIIHVNVVCDSQTNRSKGYGFVTFKDAESATRACVDGNPIIDGRKANCNLASDGENVNHNQFNIIGSRPDDLCYLSSTFMQNQQQFANFYQQQFANFHQPYPPYYWNQHYQQYLPQQQYYGSYQPQQQYYEQYQPQHQYYEQYQPQQQYYGPYHAQYVPHPVNVPKENETVSQTCTSSSLPSTPKSSSSLPSTPKSSLE